MLLRNKRVDESDLQLTGPVLLIIMGSTNRYDLRAYREEFYNFKIWLSSFPMELRTFKPKEG